MNTYPILSTPTTLSAWLAAVKQDTVNISPLDTEDANVLGSVDRQTRQWIYDYLSQCFDASGYLLAAAVGSSTLTNKVSGTSANSGGTAAEIVQGTVSTPDFRVGAVDTTALATGAVTSVKLASSAVTSSALAAGCVLTAALADLSVTNAKLALLSVASSNIQAGAVGTSNLADLSVTAAKIAAATITGDKIGASTITQSNLAVSCVGQAQLQGLSVNTAQLIDLAVSNSKIADYTIAISKLAAGTGGAQFLLTDSADSNYFALVTMSGDATMDTNGVLSLSFGSTTLVEQAAQGVNCGSSSNATKITRASTSTNASWVSLSDPKSNLAVALTTDGKIKLNAGTYSVEAFVPANGTAHRAFVEVYNSSDTLLTSLVGSNESTTGKSIVLGDVVVTSGGYLLLTHYTTTAVTNGLGVAMNISGIVENYSFIKITRIA